MQIGEQVTVEKQFKNLTPGIFRAKNGLCYTKLEKEIAFDLENKANAVIITNGQFKFFEETDTVDDLGRE